MRDFRKLKVWLRAHRLTIAFYKATSQFPYEERFGLKSQIRRSASSVPTNIAEGCGRSGSSEFSRFLQIAMGSASELEYQLLLAYDLELFSGATYERLAPAVTEVKRMLASLILKLKADS